MMLSSRRQLQQLDFKTTLKTQECSFKSNFEIHQEMYQCGQCFDYPHGICKYCFEHCHKKNRSQYHVNAKLVKIKGYFKCECGLTQHKQKKITSKQCPLSLFFGPLENCLSCSTQLCKYCKIHCRHQHNQFTSYGCGCNQFHSKHHIRSFLIEQIRVYGILKTEPYNPKNELKVTRFINSIMSNMDLFETFLGFLKNTFEMIFNELESGDPNAIYIWSQTEIQNKKEELNVQEKILELFSEKRFPYSEVSSILYFIEQLVIKMKHNLGYLNDNIWSCVTFSQTKFFISQYHIILQNTPDFKDKLTQLVLKLLKIQSYQIKYQFFQFRKIDIYSIENTTPISRNQIRQYNKTLDKGVHSAELTQLIKSYYRILFEIEITNPILSKLLIMLLKCVKIGLQTGLLIKTQVVFKVILNLEKLCRDIDYFNQQKNLGQIQRFFTEQMFNLLSKILMLTYFQLKDEQFIDILNDQIIRIDKKQISFIDKYTQFFFNEIIRNDIQINLFYNGNSEKIQIIWRVFINIVLNYNLNGEYYNQVMNSQKKLNHIIQILLRENLFIDTILYQQVQQLQIEDLLLWKFQTLKHLDSDFNTLIFAFNCHLITFLKINLQNELDIQDCEELYQKCQKVLNHQYFKLLSEFEKTLKHTFENLSKVQSAKNLQEDLKFRLNVDLSTIKQSQQYLFTEGVDINILKYFHYVTQEIFTDINQSEAISKLTKIMLEILKFMLFYNQQLINQVYTQENCELLHRLASLELPLYGKNALSQFVIKFHTDLMLNNGLVQVYPYCFINPSIFCYHLIELNDSLDAGYSDCSELSNKQASVIAYQKHQIVEMLIVILEMIVISSNEQNHDYTQFHNLCEYLYKKVLLIVINHSKELFRRKNAFSPNTSQDGQFTQKINRFSKMSLMQAIDCMQQDSVNQSQLSFYTVQSMNQSILFQQKFTIKQLKELQQKQIFQSSLQELAISTILLTHTFLRFMTLIIDYFNRNQILEDQEIKEQMNYVDKIESIHQDISDKCLKMALEGFDEISSEVYKFTNLINYSLNFKQNVQPGEILKVRENNLSVAISQKAIDDIMKQKDKRILKAMNKVLLKIKIQCEDMENEILEQNAIVQVLKKEYRNRSKDQCSHIFIDVLVELLQQCTLLERDRDYENLHTIFMSQINYIVQLQRLMQVETKAVQEIMKNIIENEDTKYRSFKINFDSFLNCISTKILPQLFLNIIAYKEQPYISRVINSGKYSIIILEFVRYLAEGQNTYLQDYVGQSGLLESLLKLLIDLFKSKQIQEIVRETNNQNKIRTLNKVHFQKAVRNVQTLTLMKKDSSTADYLQEITQKRKNSNKAKGPSNDFMKFEIYSIQGDQYGVQVSQTFLKLFAHTIITIAEFNQGQQDLNQKLTSKYLSQFRIWTVIIQILTVRTNEKQQNSVYTLRVYIFQLILSLLEDPDESGDDFQYIMNLVNHKLLEETLTQTYRALIIFNKLDLRDLSMIDSQLTELYRRELGDHINESLIFDSTMLIKILYQIFKMLNLYSSSSLEIRQYLNDQRQSCQQGQQNLFKREGDHLVRSAFQFIFNIVGSIEYLFQKDQKETLETFHFLKPPMCFYLSAETKLQFLTETIDRSNPASKLASIFDQIPSFMTEMKENMSKYRKSSSFFQYIIRVAISPNFHHRQLAISITVLNFLLIIFISNTATVIIEKDGTVKHQQVPHSFALYFSKILLIFASLSALIIQLFLRMSIYHQISCNQMKQSFYNTFIIILKILLKRDIFQFFLHFVLSILGMIEPFFFYLQSFCFIYISKTMSSVLEALRIRWIQFLGIFSVLLIILNAYSYIGFRRFTTSFQSNVIVHPENDIKEEEYLCDTPAHCFISLLYLGLREGSGLAAHGDVESYHKSSDYYPRFLFDFSFFIIVTLIMINIINGIIIDTFAELRDKQQQNEYDRNNVCVICSLERWEFEKQGIQFSEHVNEVHNLSNYVAFIVHLFQVGKQNMNGIETYIYTKILNRDMSWTPQKQTSQLNDKI